MKRTLTLAMRRTHLLALDRDIEEKLGTPPCPSTLNILGGCARCRHAGILSSDLPASDHQRQPKRLIYVFTGCQHSQQSWLALGERRMVPETLHDAGGVKFFRTAHWAPDLCLLRSDLE